MGFYGSKLLGQNTTFKFDRIYRNRKTMEENRHTDGVYIGRYVLIDYGLDDDLKNPTGEVLSRHFYLNPNSDSIEIYTYPDFETEENGKKLYRLKYAESEDAFYDIVSMQDANNNRNQNYYQKDEDSGKYVEVFPPFLGDGNVFVLKEPVNTYILKDTIIYIYKVEKYNLISSDKITDGEKVYFWKSKNENDTLGYQIYTGHIPYQDENGNILETGYNNVDFYEGVNPKKIFYYCDGKDDNGYAIFKELSNSGLSNYSINYNIDLAAYTNNNGGKGYDSTVWQKVFKDGKEYYVNIADLNTVIPTFDITVDGPTLEPRPPHFDANSTNVYYNLHTQPSWGFRVKEAKRKSLGEYNGVLSYSSLDEEVYPFEEEKIKITDYNYWENKDDVPTDREYYGAIYYNKAGFKADIRSDKETNTKNQKENSIKVTPTGQSGQKYNTHNNIPFDVEVRPDVQELSMILPGLGNTVSNLWDIAYGDWEANGSQYISIDSSKVDFNKDFDRVYYKIEGDNYIPLVEGEEPVGTIYYKDTKRNLDIDWNSTKGLRLINEKENNGYTFSTEKVDTLAGCINSVHDLMGMIIVPKDGKNWDTDDLKSADTNSIYYKESNGKYYIKDFTYDYQDFDYDEFKDSDYDNKYGYKEVSILNFDPNDNYYIKQNNDFYFQESYVPNTTYYQIQSTVEDLNTKNWESGYYYYKNELGNFIKESKAQTEYDSSKDLYDLNNISTVDYLYTTSDLTVYPIEFIKSDWYNSDNKVNKWYFKTQDGNKIIYTELDEYNYSLVEESLTYYELEFEDGDQDPENDIYIGDEPLGRRIVKTTPIKFKKRKSNYTYFYVKENNYISNDIEAHLVSSNCNEYNIVGFLTSEIVPENKFYVSNKYYYKIGEGDNYYFGDEERRRPNNEVTYYSFNENYPLEINKYFYEPNKYYYKNEEDSKFYLDTDSYDEGKNYYLKQTVHVWNDNNLALPKYTVWNPKVVDVPNGVVLKRKVIDDTPNYKWVELEGFSRTLNTIHGLIVRINHLLEFNDNETRENLSVMGCINQMHDIINSFADLVPEQFAVIDNYGRIQSADFDTSQLSTASNNKVDDNDLKDITGDKFNEVSSVDDMKKQWITVNIDGNVDEPKVTIHHNFQAVSDKFTVSDKNGNPVEGEPGLNNDVDHPDDLLLYTPIVDNMGHVVGNSIETVTLPYGYKNINGWIANSTQDTLTITDDDKWINVPIKTENNTFKITHEYPNGEVPILSTEGINLNNSDEDYFELEIPKFDEKGHIESYGNRKIILPNGFKEVNNIKAESTKDKLIIEGDNDWINVSNDNPEKILVTHKHPFEGNIPSADTDAIDLNNSSSSFSISLPNFDSTGHIESFSNKDITLPNSFKYIKDKTNTLIEPSSPTEILQITGNDWIDTAVDTTNNAITINHKEKEEIKNYGNEPLIFEGRANTVLMPKITTDKAGHIEVLESQSVTIPGRTVTIKQSKTITRYSYTTTENLIVLTDGKYAYYEANLGDKTYYIKFNNVIPAGDTVIIDKGDNGLIVSNQCEIFNAMPSGPNTNFGTLNFISETISGNSLLSSLLSGNNNFELISGNGITLDYDPPHATGGGGGYSRSPHKITISSNGSGLTIDSQLTDYISDEYTDTYYPDVEIGEDFNGTPVPIPADIQSTDTLGRTLHRLMTWIQILNRRVLELEGHTMSGNVMG